MIRLSEPDDATELARLLAADREDTAALWPQLPDRFFTPQGQLERIADREHLYAILDEGALAGTIALSNLSRGAFQSAIVGYWVSSAHRGRGLGTRAVRDVADLAFGELGLHRLEAATLVDNVASQRVLEKSSFSLIGLAPRYLRIAGVWRDHLLFQRTAED